MQPDITFFGEKLTDDFDDALKKDRDKVDLLIIIGTSLKVCRMALEQGRFTHDFVRNTGVACSGPDQYDDISSAACKMLIPLSQCTCHTRSRR